MFLQNLPKFTKKDLNSIAGGVTREKDGTSVATASATYSQAAGNDATADVSYDL